MTELAETGTAGPEQLIPAAIKEESSLIAALNILEISQDVAVMVCAASEEKVSREMEQEDGLTTCLPAGDSCSTGSKWVVGAQCQAVWSEDGWVYPATVMSLDGGHCRVCFNGYGNEEDVELHALSPEAAPQTQKDTQDWRAGSRCRVVYSEDGLVYPAVVLWVRGQRCCVRFDDYNNEEEHDLSSLLTPDELHGPSRAAATKSSTWRSIVNSSNFDWKRRRREENQGERGGERGREENQGERVGEKRREQNQGECGGERRREENHGEKQGERREENQGEKGGERRRDENQGGRGVERREENQGEIGGARRDENQKGRGVERREENQGEIGGEKRREENQGERGGERREENQGERRREKREKNQGERGGKKREENQGEKGGEKREDNQDRGGERREQNQGERGGERRKENQGERGGAKRKENQGERGGEKRREENQGGREGERREEEQFKERPSNQRKKVEKETEEKKRGNRQRDEADKPTNHSFSVFPPFPPPPHTSSGDPVSFIPPPPPPLWMFGQSGSSAGVNATSSMLMLWYMCGFHTGSYMAQQLFRSNSRD